MNNPKEAITNELDYLSIGKPITVGPNPLKSLK